jgi:hypothetical protein
MKLSKPWDLVVTMGIAIAATVIVIGVPTGDPVRIAVAIPLVLFLPGYALTSACFSRAPLPLAEQAVLSLGLTISIDIVLALVVDRFSGGFDSATWALILGPGTVATCGVALFRGHLPRLPSRIQYSSRLTRITRSASAAVLFALAGALVAFAIAISSSGAADRAQGHFTILAAKPSGTIRPGYKVEILNDDTVTNHYRLEIAQGTHLLARQEIGALDPGQSWDELVGAAADSASTEPVRIELYRNGDLNRPYRRLAYRQAPG